MGTKCSARTSDSTLDAGWTGLNQRRRSRTILWADEIEHCSSVVDDCPVYERRHTTQFAHETISDRNESNLAFGVGHSMAKVHFGVFAVRPQSAPKKEEWTLTRSC